jgi:mannose-1-phosphate guanylyltransferase
MKYAVILAGGSGTRLWPLSRRSAPKQVRALLDEETLLQKAYRRARQSFPPDRVFVSTLAEHLPEVRRQLPELPAGNDLVEPIGRDTAAAIGYVALRLSERDPEAIFVTINADAYVGDEPAYADTIAATFRAAEASDGGVALVGLVPRYPETGYGYVELAAPVGDRFLQPAPAVRFVEKPDAATAAQYVESGRYLWNPALFVFRASSLLDAYAEHLPTHAASLQTLRGVTDSHAVTRAFLAMPKVSVDYGIMEKLTNLVVVPASFPWADVGHWRAVHEILSKDPNADVVRGTHVGVAGNGNLVVAPPGKLVATYGLEQCVIIDTNDALLICPRDRAQEVKKVVEELERRGLTEYL